MSIKALPGIRTLVAALLAAGLTAGCGGSQHQAISLWMAAVSKDMPRMVESIAEPKKYAPYKYESSSLIDPFDAVRATLADKQLRPRNPLAPQPDPKHVKQPLEAFPLETLKMVGALQQKGESYAFVKSDAGLIRVKVGDFMGQDYGRVTAIDESKIALTELVRDSGGDYVERSSTLQLQEEKR